MVLNIFLLNLFLSYFLMWVTYPLFKKHILDKPNNRTSHKSITPRGGGIIFVIVSVFTCIFFDFFAPLIAFPLAIVGLIDDKFGLNKRIRFFVQIITTIFIIIYSFSIWNITDLSNLLLIGIALFLLLLGTSIINFSNFVDGIDGILIGNMIIIFLSLSLIFDDRYLLISGALLGFLKWNWYPAKIFMGDVGSTFLGAILFFAIISTSSLDQSLAILIISAPILIDPLTCVIRRLLNSEPIFQAHKKHLYQRLNQAGWNHGNISLIYSLVYIVIVFVILLFLYLKNISYN